MVSITDILIILIHCEHSGLKHFFHCDHSTFHSLLSYYLYECCFFMKIYFMICLGFHSCYIISFNVLPIINFIIKLPNICFIIPIWIPSFLKILSNNVHVNPGPNNNKTFSFCNWNWNSITKDGFSRVDQFNVQASTNNYDIISLCETLLYDEVEIPNPLTL